MDTLKVSPMNRLSQADIAAQDAIQKMFDANPPFIDARGVRHFPEKVRFGGIHCNCGLVFSGNGSWHTGMLEYAKHAAEMKGAL